MKPEKMSLEELDRAIEKTKAEIATVRQKRTVFENKFRADEEKLRKMERNIRTHRLCTQGGMLGKFLIEPDMLTDEQVYDILELAFSYSGVQELLKKYLDEYKSENKDEAN